MIGDDSLVTQSRSASEEAREQKRKEIGKVKRVS